MIYIFLFLILSLYGHAEEQLACQAEQIFMTQLKLRNVSFRDFLLQKWNNSSERNQVIKDFLIFYETMLRSVFTEKGNTVSLNYMALKEIAPVYFLYLDTLNDENKSKRNDILVLSYLISGNDVKAKKIIKEELSKQTHSVVFDLLAAGFGCIENEPFFTQKWDSLYAANKKHAFQIYFFFSSLYESDGKKIRIPQQEMLLELNKHIEVIKEMNSIQVQGWMMNLISLYLKRNSKHSDLNNFRKEIESDPLYSLLAAQIPEYTAYVIKWNNIESIAVSKRHKYESLPHFKLETKIEKSKQACSKGCNVARSTP